MAYDVTIGSRIAITGDVTLNLCGGATLNAPKGIELTSDNSLTINGPGALVINNCDKDKSGIGASSVGTLVINGGTINVTGGVFGAGIGGDRRNCAGGSITINGGTVTATGGNSAPGIGGGLDDCFGNYGLCGDITINGGQVTATGSNSAPGIGPGCEYGEQQHYGSGTLTLGWTSPTDFISNSGFTNDMGRTLNSITFADGKVFVLDGTTTLATADNIAGQKIVPALTLADRDDNSSTIETYDGKTMAVVLDDRTLYKDGKWNTLCLPFSLSAEQIDANTDFAGATLMTMDVTKKNGFDVEDGTLYLGFKTATTIEAGVPYLVKWEKAAYYEGNEANYDISNPVFEGVTISNSTAQAVESSTEGLETVQMVGTYSPVSVTANDKSILFLGDANTLYYSTVDRQIRSCRAYFSVPYINGHAEAKARAFALSFDGEETTGILEVSANSNEVKDDIWYSLDGVRLSGNPTQRGLYINNGKKVVIK